MKACDWSCVSPIFLGPLYMSAQAVVVEVYCGFCAAIHMGGPKLTLYFHVVGVYTCMSIR